MNIGFVYDIMENVFPSATPLPLSELTTELFSSAQANAIIAGLRELGHRICVIDGADAFSRDVLRHREELDLVFNEAKGLFGPDRKMIVPALCRIHGIPYLGSDAYAVTLARNKWHTLAVGSFAGVSVPESLLVPLASQDKARSWTSFPAIVKPNFESSSIGISTASVVMDPPRLLGKILEVHTTYAQAALVQEFIPGIELQIAVVGNRPPRALRGVSLLPPEGQDIITNEDWRTNAVTIVPFNDSAIEATAAKHAIRLFEALAFQDYGRMDFRVTPSGALFFIEAATHPHITPDSAFALAAKQQGMTFGVMLKALLAAAQERYKPLARHEP